MDSLSNSDAIRFFTAEGFEAERFRRIQKALERQHVRVSESLAFLNVGQQLIFCSGLGAALFYTASLVASGALPVGQLVLVSTLLIQVRFGDSRNVSAAQTPPSKSGWCKKDWDWCFGILCILCSCQFL